MSNVSGWKSKPSERKTSKSIYLSIDDWDWLYTEGKGSPVNCIREMISLRRQEKKSEPLFSIDNGL